MLEISNIPRDIVNKAQTPPPPLVPPLYKGYVQQDQTIWELKTVRYTGLT